MPLTCLGLGYDARIYRERPLSAQLTDDEHPTLSTVALIIYALLTFLT